MAAVKESKQEKSAEKKLGEEANAIRAKREDYDVESPAQSAVRRPAAPVVLEVLGEDNEQRITVTTDGPAVIVEFDGKKIRLSREGVVEAQRVFTQLGAGL